MTMTMRLSVKTTPQTKLILRLPPLLSLCCTRATFAPHTVWQGCVLLQGSAQLCAPVHLWQSEAATEQYVLELLHLLFSVPSRGWPYWRLIFCTWRGGCHRKSKWAAGHLWAPCTRFNELARTSLFLHKDVLMDISLWEQRGSFTTLISTTAEHFPRAQD